MSRPVFQGTFFSSLLIIIAVHWLQGPAVTWSVGDVYPDSTCTLSAQYPDSIRRWCGLIEHNAREHNLDPHLIAAVMLQESGGNPAALSKSGAVGLMQVMPRDGAAAQFICRDGPCFANRPTMLELYNPGFNIAYGCRMLSGLVSKHGSLREALKAYGPTDVGYTYADIVLSIYWRYQ